MITKTVADRRNSQVKRGLTIDRRALLQSGAAFSMTAALSPGASAPATGWIAGDTLRLGACCYPEQWPVGWGREEAAEMARRGISYVRIGDFDWASIEREPGRFDWGWIDAAVTTLDHAKLKIVMCTPTAAPPKWLVDAYPEILPVAENGMARGFGSRRHYTLASEAYRRECRRIVTAVVDRFGRHPAVVGWQIDNELGCHDTAMSWGPVDLAAWKRWLIRRYGTIDALNAAWGTSFWSMRVSGFEQVILPAGAVTETAPTARMDFRRFASEQLVAFAAMQAKLIRAGSPGRFVTTNAMAFFPDFDHFALGREMDFMSWDSYPLGNTAAIIRDEGMLRNYARTGHPDVPGFNHDLMRGISQNRPFWVMEQQPGPVNWSPWNGVPEIGMVRTWVWEAFAHGAATVSLYRWRQATFGQEEMHAGLERPDGKMSQGGIEIEQVRRELATVGPLPAPARATVALVFDYESVWYAKVQPQGADFNVTLLALAFYSALRRQGLDVDIVAPGAALDEYKLVMVPMLAIPTPAAVAALTHTDAMILFGPRAGSKTDDIHIPDELPPGPLQRLLPLKVIQVGSMRPGLVDAVQGSNMSGAVSHWREWLETDLPALATFADGEKAVVHAGRRVYIAGWPDDALLDGLIAHVATRVGLALTPLPQDVRLRRRGDMTFAVNYGASPQAAPAPAAARYVLGGATIAPHSVSAWRAPA